MEFESLYPFWPDLSDSDREYVRQSCYTENVKKGTVMNCGTDQCKGVFATVTGQMRVYIISEEGREVTLFRVNEGEICVLSAFCLMETIRFEVLLEATADSVCLILPTVCLKNILKRNPKTELYLYRAAAIKFSEIMWSMQEILFKKVDRRIAGFLLREMDEKQTATLYLTHDEIAKDVGSAREVVSKALKYLAEQKVLELGRGKITIPDRKKLEKWYEE